MARTTRSQRCSRASLSQSLARSWGITDSCTIGNGWLRPAPLPPPHRLHFLRRRHQRALPTRRQQHLLARRGRMAPWAAAAVFTLPRRCSRSRLRHLACLEVPRLYPLRVQGLALARGWCIARARFLRLRPPRPVSRAMGEFEFDYFFFLTPLSCLFPSHSLAL